ncbi:hypothetical protein Rhe02_35300 [Rhizocola hellebori]|uniref:Uncharacterized protein n=1 Tax=Rhizocola hellebori TaxID=1392758 RepID=A0A8J3Q7D5_9ACTN|nr:hypothetical protein Rhe02_35300 [Rhizocola hellebori]
MGEGGGDQVFIGGHPLYVGGALTRVDLQYLAELANIEPCRWVAGSKAEQIRRALGQPNGRIRR